MLDPFGIPLLEHLKHQAMNFAQQKQVLQKQVLPGEMALWDQAGITKLDTNHPGRAL